MVFQSRSSEGTLEHTSDGSNTRTAPMQAVLDCFEMKQQECFQKHRQRRGSTAATTRHCVLARVAPLLKKLTMQDTMSVVQIQEAPPPFPGGFGAMFGRLLCSEGSFIIPTGQELISFYWSWSNKNTTQGCKKNKFHWTGLVALEKRAPGLHPQVRCLGGLTTFSEVIREYTPNSSSFEPEDVPRAGPKSDTGQKHSSGLVRKPAVLYLEFTSHFLPCTTTPRDHAPAMP